MKLVSGPFMYLDRNKLIIEIRRQCDKTGGGGGSEAPEYVEKAKRGMYSFKF
jgi:hypothetical protein